MKMLIATLLATAAGASFAATPAAALKHDPETYRSLTQKAAADYRKAAADCAALSGNDKDVCKAEAKATRAHAEADAVAKYSNTDRRRESALKKVADADYAVAKEKCDAQTGADRDTCVDNAKSVHAAALADAKASRNRMAADTGEQAKSAAAAKCEHLSGPARTACLVDNKVPVTEATGAAPVTGSSAAGRTESAAERAADKTRHAASDATQRTENAMETAGEKTRDAAANVATSDTAITTKVKAGLFREPDLKAMGIHVETEKGVVMLSGFVESKAEADKAVKVAKSVEGVTSVKNAIKVK